MSESSRSITGFEITDESVVSELLSDEPLSVKVGDFCPRAARKTVSAAAAHITTAAAEITAAFLLRFFSAGEAIESIISETKPSASCGTPASFSAEFLSSMKSL